MTDTYPTTEGTPVRGPLSSFESPLMREYLDRIAPSPMHGYEASAVRDAIRATYLDRIGDDA